MIRRTIALEPFAYRHFDQPDFGGKNNNNNNNRYLYLFIYIYIGTKISISKQEFVSKINEYYETSWKAAEASSHNFVSKETKE